MSGLVIFLLNATPVSWKTQLQRTVSASTCEAEIVALLEAAKEAIHLRRLLKDLNQKQTAATLIFCDNQPAIEVVKEPKEKGRTKHIDVKLKKIREWIGREKIRVEYVASKDNIADVFTKPTKRESFKQLSNRLIASPLRGGDVTNEDQGLSNEQK